MKKMLGNRKAVSPVLAVLLLIAIAVGAAVVTYAWVMGFVGTQTQQAGGVLVEERITWNNVTDGNCTVTIRNTGTGRATIDIIYAGLEPGKYNITIDNFKTATPPGSALGTTVDTLDIDPGEVYDINFVLNTNVAGDTVYIRILTTAGSRLDLTSTAPTA